MNYWKTMTKTTFKKGITIFTACVKDYPLDAEKAGVWFELLKDLGDEVFLKAVHTVCQTNRDIYPGTNIVALIREATQRGMETQIVLAWDKFEKAFHKHCPQNSVVFDDLVIHQVIVALGGWDKLGDTVKTDWKWVRKDFERLYQIYAPVIDKLNPPEKITGFLERDNASKGFDKFIPKPVYIGGKKQKELEG